jgi:hypothetical protein
MKKLLKPRWVALLAAIVLVAIQLKPVSRSNPPIQSEIGTSNEIRDLLRRACYDCHSNETRWPWYSYVAPVSWLVVGHVDDARGHLNFSEWPAFDVEEQAHLFEEMWEEVSQGQMPLRSYTLMHRDARLSDEAREALLQWMRPEPPAGVGDPDDGR